MSDPVTFTVAGTPRPQGSKSIGHSRTGAAFLRESGAELLRPWRKAVRSAAVDATGWTKGAPAVLDGPVGLVLTFAMRWPASHHGRRTWPTARPDVDKLVRAVLDACTGVVFTDDAQVVSLTARKVWAGHDVEWPEGLHVWANHVPGYSPPPTSPR